MKKLLFLAFLICWSIQILSAQSLTEKNKTKIAVLRHVVMFKFQDKATPAGIKKVEEGLTSLEEVMSIAYV